MSDKTYEYGFTYDGNTPVMAYMFGLPYKSAASAEHTAVKWYTDTYEILRRENEDSEWEPVPDDEYTYYDSTFVEAGKYW